MSELTGTLCTNDATEPLVGTVLQIRPVYYPLAPFGGGTVFSGAVFEVTTGEDGAFTIELPANLYRIEWRVREIVNRGFFALTSAGGDLADLLISTIEEAAPYAFSTLAEFRASTTNARLVGVQVDANGDPAIFRAQSGSTVDDGVNGVVRDDGAAYVRFSGNPIA